MVLCAVFCWENLGPGIYVDVNLTCASYSDQVRPFMAMVFSNGSGFFQQDSAPSHTLFWNGLRNMTNSSGYGPGLRIPQICGIEQSWDVLEQEVQSAAAPSCKLQNLKHLLLASWCQTSQSTPADSHRNVLSTTSSSAVFLKAASHIGLRQVLPVQTKSIFIFLKVTPPAP